MTEKINFETKNIFTAIVGRPNVGKSSLLNKMVGEKVAIVTSKPQTTRTQITGIITKKNIQYVFLDTPGIHKARTRLGGRMVKASTSSIADVDAVLMLFEPYGELNEPEQQLLAAIKKSGLPAVAVINKKDTVKKSADLDERVNYINGLSAFDTVLCVSAAQNDGVDEVLDCLSQYALDGPHYFPDDAYTDMPEKALVAEFIREKLLLNLYDEIPHGTAVTVEKFKERKDSGIIDIDVNIYCEKKSHKGMIIGKGGAMLKKIATGARIECEEFLGAKVNLQCWVKVKEDWRDNDLMLNNFGFQK